MYVHTYGTYIARCDQVPIEQTKHTSIHSVCLFYYLHLCMLAEWNVFILLYLGCCIDWTFLP